MFVCGWNYGLRPDPVFSPTNIPYLRDGPPDVERLLQTWRPYGTIPSLYDCATNVPSRWDGFLRSTIVLQTFRPYGTVPPMLNDCYKHFVPTGRFPRLYDCATNVPSLWDGFLRSMIVLHNWSLWDRLVADLRSVRNGNLVVNIGGYSMTHTIGGETLTVYATCDRWCPASCRDAMFVETV